jgi:SAM-dependent methyltransferase
VIVNRDDHARGPADSFASVADAYERGRPGYPTDAVRWLVGEEACDVVDLGAGTGKLTRTLVALGHRVVAVEPLAAMRAHLASTGATVLEGSAEQIPLPDATADAVVCAQAFHWLDHQRALPEIARVLRLGGRLAVVWNVRDEREPWVRRLSALIGSESVGAPDVDRHVEASGLFGAVERADFAFEQRLDGEALRDLVVSRSYCAKLEPAEREPTLAAVTALYDEVAAPDGLVLPYVVQCFRTALTVEGAHT